VATAAVDRVSTTIWSGGAAVGLYLGTGLIGGQSSRIWPFMKTKTYFVFRVNIWDDTGDSIVEHVAGVDDFEVAEATYRAAVARWPAARITLRQGIRVVHDTG